MSEQYAAGPAAEPEHRWRVLGIAVALGLTAAASAATIVNFARTKDLPTIPMSQFIAPAQLSEARFAVAVGRGNVSPAIAAAARVAGRAEPLADEPFLLTAASDFVGDRSIGRLRDERLIEEALRRNPRSRRARMLTLRRALGTQKLAPAIQQIAELNRLGQGSVVTLLQGVGRMLISSGQVKEALTALAPYPDLYLGITSGFVATEKPPALTVLFADSLPRNAIGQAEVRSLLLGRLIDDGSYTAARRLAARVSGQANAPTIRNPAFAKQPPQPPFDWELTESDVGVAERQAEGGIYVEHYGRSSGPLLRQLLTLPAGGYQSRLVYEQLSEATGAIELRIFCAQDGTALLRQKLDAAGSRSLQINLLFKVPGAGCTGQYVALYALPQERRLGQQLVVRRLDIAPGILK